MENSRERQGRMQWWNVRVLRQANYETVEARIS